MKKWVSACAVAMGLSVASVAHALDVAVLDVPQALFSSDRAKSFMKGLDKEFSDSEQRLETLARDIQANQQKLKKDGGIMKDDDRQKLQNSLKDEVSEYRFLQQKVQSGRASRQQQFLDANRPLLDKLIRELINKKDVKVILSRQGTVYVSETADLTPDLIKSLNKSK
ncbi:OmpH family outer membrane protein [Pokkaliibacter sp. CJK22405]|uniref:OmpH family outer membrane protein n=1 Tax=Pokkaliibacter sp. CJK22405 TaxID=3384615 RepID=UPI003984AAEB